MFLQDIVYWGVDNWYKGVLKCINFDTRGRRGVETLDVFMYLPNGWFPETCWVNRYGAFKLLQVNPGLIWDFLILI